MIKKIKQLAIFCISVIIAALISLLPAYYNHFPFVNSDSGSYIAYTTLPGSQIDRSVFYSYFIYLASVGKSLKLYIIVQSLVGSVLIFSLLKPYFSWLKTSMVHILVVGILTIFTPYAWFVSLISPDIFIGYFVLGLIGWLLYHNNNWMKAFYLLLISVSMLLHNSILLLGLMVGLLGIMLWCMKYRKIPINKYVSLVACSLIMYCTAATVSKIHNNHFTPNPSSHVFILSRIAETGLLNEVLARDCPEKKT